MHPVLLSSVVLVVALRLACCVIIPLGVDFLASRGEISEGEGAGGLPPPLIFPSNSFQPLSVLIFFFSLSAALLCFSWFVIILIHKHGMVYGIAWAWLGLLGVARGCSGSLHMYAMVFFLCAFSWMYIPNCLCFIYVLVVMQCVLGLLCFALLCFFLI